MIKGIKITWEDILKATNQGYDIFKIEIGNFPVGKAFKSPLKMKDDHPSFAIFYKDGVYWFRDASLDLSGTALQFVMHLHGLNGREAIKKMAEDCGLAAKSDGTYAKKVLWQPPKIKELETVIDFDTMPFNEAHAKYWNDYHITEEHCKRKNIWRVKDWAVDKKRMGRIKGELTFAYYAKDIDKVKILRIGVPKEKKWRNTVPGDYLWGFPKEKCSKLMIVKAYKDSCVWDLFGVCSTATQQEGLSCILPNVDRINEVSDDVFINFGTDEQGKRESRKVTQMFNYRHYNIPDKYLEIGVNDVAELAKYNIKLLESHLKQKGII